MAKPYTILAGDQKPWTVAECDRQNPRDAGVMRYPGTILRNIN
jgi:hypothetical protein